MSMVIYMIFEMTISGFFYPFKTITMITIERLIVNTDWLKLANSNTSNKDLS